MNFKGHEYKYEHFRTDRHSGLMPYHFKKRRNHKAAFDLLLGICIITGCASLGVFIVQLFR